jgi:hypothetical protein
MDCSSVSFGRLTFDEENRDGVICETLIDLLMEGNPSSFILAVDFARATNPVFPIRKSSVIKY